MRCKINRSSNFWGSPVTGLISYPLDEGRQVLIEVEDDIKGTVTRRLHPGEIIETVGTKFETAIEPVRPAVVAVASKFHDFTGGPDDVEVEFGLNFGGQAGAVIASASTEAQFRVKMVRKGKPGTAVT
jgi:hypothetical protein